MFPTDQMYWSSADNNMKLWPEGCVSNLLYFLKLPDAARDFKVLLSTLDAHSLAKEMKLNKLPNNIQASPSNFPDPIQKCLWLLQVWFNCQRCELNLAQFRSPATVINNLSQIKFPVIISLEITNSTYDHIIVVWKNLIIDFQHPTTYPLTIANLHFSCGLSLDFVKIKRGYGILPSKEIKKACDDLTDGGKSNINGRLKYLFKGETNDSLTKSN